MLNTTNSTTDLCLIRPKNNKIFLTNVYEGIPQTLILNVTVWLCVIILFSIIRKKAWNHGRLGLINRRHAKNRKWIEVFYAREDSLREEFEGGASGSNNNRRNDGRYSIFIPNDNGFLGWAKVTCQLTDEQFRKSCGPDAVHYLSFQRHLMIVMAIITVISIGIILPVNYHGSLIDPNSFARTTVSNVPPDSPLLWIHVIASIAYIPIVVMIMRRASGRAATKHASTRTVMIENIEKSRCNATFIHHIFHRDFPEIKIIDLDLAYDVQKLTECTEKYSRVVEARKYCERRNVHMRESCCSRNKIDALEYYEIKEEKLRRRVNDLRDIALSRPLGIAFVTVNSAQSARFIVDSYRMRKFTEWDLRYAPTPPDIFWENLQSDYGQWFCKWIIVNASLFIVLFFLTTPIIIVKLLGDLNGYLKMPKFNNQISEFASTLMLLAFAITMPAMVAYTEKLLSHQTRSKLNYTIMTKAFGYLLFMILILPSLGLTSAQAFIEFTILSSFPSNSPHFNQYNQNDTDNFGFRCVFLPGRGAFYVNYVMTAAFIGTAFELMRIPELIDYIWQLCWTKSRAEVSYIRSTILNEYPYGSQYAWTILIFTITTVYSLACPLIMPFAMIYIGLKHFVDRHNLYFAYGQSDMISQGGGRIHSSAVTMTKLSVILLLIATAAFQYVRLKGIFDSKGVILIITLNVTIVLFVFMAFIKRMAFRKAAVVEPMGDPPRYVAPVLVPLFPEPGTSSARNSTIEARDVTIESESETIVDV